MSKIVPKSKWLILEHRHSVIKLNFKKGVIVGLKWNYKN